MRTLSYRIWLRKWASVHPRCGLAKLEDNLTGCVQFSQSHPQAAFAEYGDADGLEGSAGRDGEEDVGNDPHQPRHDTSPFRRLVLGWFNADFRVQIHIFQHFSKSTRKSSSREQILQISAKKITNFAEVLTVFNNFCKIL